MNHETRLAFHDVIAGLALRTHDYKTQSESPGRSLHLVYSTARYPTMPVLFRNVSLFDTAGQSCRFDIQTSESPRLDHYAQPRFAILLQHADRLILLNRIF